MLDVTGFGICSLNSIPERTIVSNRQDACSTRKFTLCGTGILPVHKKLIENGATSQFKIDLTVNAKDLEETVWRYLCIAKESGATLAKNSLLAVKNDASLVRRQV